MPAHAGWSEDGVAIPSGSRLSTFFRAVPDGWGGLTLAYWHRSGQIEAVPVRTRLLPNGEIAPGDPAYLDLESVNWQSEPVDIAPDGSGGVFVAWSSGLENPRVQHLLPDGPVHAAWPNGGKKLTAWLAGGSAPRVMPDGSGGVLVAWVSPPDSVRLIRLEADGAVSPGWPGEGLLLSVPDGGYLGPPLDVLPAGGGGAYVAWADMDAVYIQSVLGTGGLAPGWPAGGASIAGAGVDPLTTPRLLPSPGDYVQLHWKRVAGPYIGGAAAGTLTAMRLSAAGAPAPGWPSEGLAVFASDSAFSAPIVMGDGAGGALLAWALRGPAGPELRVLRTGVNGAPSPGWSADGVSVVQPPGSFAGLEDYTTLFRDLGFGATIDGAGGAIVTWNDDRSGERSVRAARVLASGALDPAWPAGGLRVTPPGGGASLELLSDGIGGAVAIWIDDPNYLGGVPRATRIEAGVVVPVQVSLATAEAVPGGARLAWVVTQLGAGRVTIERRLGDAAWQPLAMLVPDGTGRVAYEDAGLAPGARVGYRLAYDDAGTPRTAGEVALVIPGHAAFGITAVSPNPAGAEVALRFALESDAPARLELYDTAGRRVRSAAVNAAPGIAATHRFDRLDRLPPGMYHARLVQGGRSDAVRLTLMR